MTNPIITLAEVSYRRQSRTILQNISLTIRPAELITVIGPNGSGKSTLLKLLLGLLKPSSGYVHKLPQLKVGYMPQKLFLDETIPISVKDFLQLSPSKKSIFEVLNQVHLTAHQNTLMHELSGGEFQRTLLARALMQAPDLYVLDEPVQGVDVMGQSEMYRLIQSLRDQAGAAIILVSHDLHFVHAASDHVICLNHHICCQGTPQDVQRHPDYLSLFGQTLDSNLALYTHFHDHAHDHGSKEI